MTQQFSEAELALQIKFVRDACRRIKAQPALAERDLGPLLDVLDRLVAETGAINAIRAEAAQALGGRNADQSYEQSAHQIADRFKTVDVRTPAGLSDLAGVLKAEDRFWQDCDNAVQREIADSAAQAPIDDAPASARIDPAALANFINTLPGEGAVRVTSVRVASEGFSKVTLFVALDGARTLPDSIVLRMDKAFNYLGTTVRDEFSAIKLLFEHGARVPQPYAMEPSGSVLGGPFLLLARCAGANKGKRHFPPPASPALMRSIAQAMARVHTTPIDTGVQIGARAPSARPFIDEEIEAYEKTWRSTGAACPSIDAALAWIKANIDGAYGASAIVHNDFDFHNFILDGETLTGVVDWEFVHVGNPVADIGYFRDSIDKTVGLDAFLEDYVAAGGARPRQDEIDFYTVWGHMRLAIMSFQTELAFREARFDDLRYALASVHFMRKPILGYIQELAKIVDRQILDAGRG